MRSAPALAEAQSRLLRDFRCRPLVATEIEFYLHGAEGHDLGPFWASVEATAEDERIAIYKTEKERGREQYEVALAPQAPAEIVRQTRALCLAVEKAAAELDLVADFCAKPFAEEPGSGLHVHVHLEGEAGENLYYKKDDAISDALKWSIGGLLATLPLYMDIFAPSPASRARYVAGGEVPTTVSWGANNRTVAIRLPDGGAPHRHIEHRVAGADAEVEAVIAAILAGIHHGLVHRCDPGPQTYGDASLPMYNLPKLLAG